MAKENALPVLLGAKGFGEKSGKKGRRRAPVALDLPEEESMKVSIRIKNTFIEQADVPSSLEVFDNQREVRTCPSKRIGCLASSLAASPEADAPPLLSSPCSIRTPCGLQSPLGIQTPCGMQTIRTPFNVSSGGQSVHTSLDVQSLCGMIGQTSLGSQTPRHRQGVPTAIEVQTAHDPWTPCLRESSLGSCAWPPYTCPGMADEYLGVSTWPTADLYGTLLQQTQHHTVHEIAHQMPQEMMRDVMALPTLPVSATGAWSSSHPVARGVRRVVSLADALSSAVGVSVGGASGTMSSMEIGSSPRTASCSAMPWQDSVPLVRRATDNDTPGYQLATPSLPPPPPGPALGTSELPSFGSRGHAAGQCKPCAFLYTKGCENDLKCQFCHLCEPGERNRRKKEKLEARRNARRGL